MNGILKEMVILQVAAGRKLSYEELAEAATDWEVEGKAFMIWLRDTYTDIMDDVEALAALILEDELEGYSMSSLVEEFNDRFYGFYDSVEGFAANYFAETSSYETIKALEDSGLDSAIDWELYWSSQLMFDFWEIEGYFFRNM